jgi:hypothetical protein
MEIIIDKKYNSLFENEDALVMQKEIEEIIMKSTWIIDTPELRSKINSEIEKLLCPYLRDKNLNFLLSEEIDSPSQSERYLL